MLQLCFPVNNEVQTIFSPILIPDNNTRELRNHVNPTNKKLVFHVFWTFYGPTKNLGKLGEKQSREPVHVG